MANFNAYVGWGVSTLALWFLNKRNKKNDSSSATQPSSLNVTENATRLGSPIPVILGRGLVKSPLVAYFGDFRSEPYTETYAAHANFNAWPLVFSLIAAFAARPYTAHNTTPVKVPGSGLVTTKGDKVVGSATIAPTQVKTKDPFIPILLNSLFTFLLQFLINSRNLKTTIQKGFKYYLGYQFLICWYGEDIKVKNIYFKENNVFTGSMGISQNPAGYVLSVNNPDLFGGPDEEGGFIGEMRVYFGGEGQTNDAWMIQQMNQESVQPELRGLTPIYRPFLSAVIPTSYIGKTSNIPETWVEVQNIPNRLGLGAIGEDANPAEVIYELHVNNNWGLNESPDALDLDSIIKMGQTLKAEGLGISVHMDTVTTAGDLINNICDHIGAAKFDDPSTGKTCYKLIRGDYDINTLPILDISNCSSCSFTRTDWSEVVTSISANYKEATAFYEEASVPIYDSANRYISNTVTNKNIDFTMFTTAPNALYAGQREMTAQGYPVAVASLVANRKLHRLRIGDCFRLQWKPYGLTDIVMRITDIDLGDFLKGEIKIDAMEDVFAFSKQVYDYNSGTEWTVTPKYPTGVQQYRFIEMPFEIMHTRDTYIYGLACNPNPDTVYWTTWRMVDGLYVEITTKNIWTPTGNLVYNYNEDEPYQDEEGFDINAAGYKYDIDELYKRMVESGTDSRDGGNLLLIDNEIMSYETLIRLPNGQWRVKGVLRGVCDTVPETHVQNATVFFLDINTMSNITGNKAATTAGKYTTQRSNITTATVDNKEVFNYAKVVTINTRRRTEAPSLPGDFKFGYYRGINDETHTPTVLTRFLQNPLLAGDIFLTYEPRNKFTANAIVAQDDIEDYYSHEPYITPIETKYIMQVTVDGQTVRTEYESGTLEIVTEEIETIDEDGNVVIETIVVGEQIVPIKNIKYDWIQRCKQFPNTLARTTLLELLSTNSNVDSYSKHSRVIEWATPTLIAIGSEQYISQQQSQLIQTGGRAVVPEGAYNNAFVVEQRTAPLFLVGVEDNNGILGRDGKKYLPTGKAYYTVNQTEMYEFDLEEWYTFKSDYTIDKTKPPTYYRWDGEKLIELDIREE